MSRKKRRNKKKQKSDLKIDAPLAEVIECFSACGRCSYFWAGYRVIAGEKVIDTVVKENDPIWLNLPWSHPVRDLVHKSYGIRFDVDYFHHEGSCKECQRQFIYTEDLDDEQEPEEAAPESVEAPAPSENGETEDSDPKEENSETAPAVRAHFKIERMPCLSKA